MRGMWEEAHQVLVFKGYIEIRLTLIGSGIQEDSLWCLEHSNKSALLLLTLKVCDDISVGFGWVPLSGGQPRYGSRRGCWP